MIQNDRFAQTLGAMSVRLANKRPLENVVPELFADALAALDAVPIPRTSVILEAHSPFTAYCKLRELCQVDATKTLTWLDPYLSANIFHRYLSSVRLNVPVALVTSEPKSGNPKEKARWTEVLDLSRLYARERGPNLYRLVVCPSLHDRWVVFDEKRIYSLGGSAKDAGSKDYFTITSVESSAENLQKIQTQIATGTDFFGPKALQHL